MKHDNTVEADLTRPAGFWIRVLASLIDFALFIPLGLIGWWATQRGIIPVIIAINVPFLIYKPLMEARYGATVGKMVCRIMVRDLNGHYISQKTAYCRFIPFLAYNIAHLILAVQLFQNADYFAATTAHDKAMIIRSYPLYNIKQLLSLLLLVDCAAIAFRKQKMAIHDSMAGTLCIYKKRSSQQSAAQVQSEGAPSG